MNSTVEPRRVYKHFKGRLYYVFGIFEHTETGELFVAYQALYEPYKNYIRPLESFTSRVDLKKYPNATQEYRFELYNN